MNNILNSARTIAEQVESLLAESGIMFRIFCRAKTAESLNAKLNKDPGKYVGDKKIQDIIGIRIALYFIDDISVAKNLICNKFAYLPEHSTIDTPKDSSFSATRYNLMFSLPDDHKISDGLEDRYKSCVDDTFELQLRTILSEGWHEIDHDLRYKCESDWIGLPSESRILNGVYATLETSEWTLLKLFEDISYKHYKSRSWSAMLQNKFRIRLRESLISKEILEVLDADQTLCKAIYRYDRDKLFKCLSERPSFPLTADNIIHIMNLDSFKDVSLTALTPQYFKNWWATA
ncbi:RelA/SpoT protein [Pseudomonas sp. CCUG 57209]|uniref:RelA/SpoT protein n=1 Tax=Pseudomonas sivasensis TaxID=1880678 RepID=UPI0015EBC7E7|nr:RelA/SpoT protein [Pseudomonas sivasensis]MBA2928590.1 RelA/SpoT protein [Pseudomonas sivasensis]